jgi:hypothetical protein
MESLVRPNTLLRLLAPFSDMTTAYGERHLAKPGALKCTPPPPGPKALKLAKGVFFLGWGGTTYFKSIFSSSLGYN